MNQEQENSFGREIESVTDPTKIQNLLKNHLNGRTLFIKDSDPPVEVKIQKVLDHNIAELLVKGIHLTQHTPLELFIIIGRYIQIQCVVLQSDAAHIYTVHVRSCSIARRQREFLRIPVREEDAYIKNIRISKDTINASEFVTPTSVKVSFAIYEQKLKGSANYVKIDTFTSANNNIIDEVRRQGKPLLISDTSKENLFYAPSTDYVDFVKFAKTQSRLQAYMKEYNQKRVLSEVIVPIQYKSGKDILIPIGYIHLQSKSERYDDMKVKELLCVADEIIQRIIDANTLLIETHQRVVNISRGGMKLLITNPQLKEALVNRESFSFDLFFKKQAPITMLVMLRAVKETTHHHLLIGVQITGNSSRANEMKRYIENIHVLEKGIQEQLAKRRDALAKLKSKS